MLIYDATIYIQNPRKQTKCHCDNDKAYHTTDIYKNSNKIKINEMRQRNEKERETTKINRKIRTLNRYKSLCILCVVCVYYDYDDGPFVCCHCCNNFTNSFCSSFISFSSATLNFLIFSKYEFPFCAGF